MGMRGWEQLRFSSKEPWVGAKVWITPNVFPQSLLLS